VLYGLVLHVHERWVFFGVHVAVASDHGPGEGVRAGRLGARLADLKLNGLGLGETALQAEGLGGHFLGLGVAALHFEFVGFLEVVVNGFLQLSEVGLTPLPLVAVLSEVLPGDELGPFREKTRELTRYVRDFADDGLIL
jgi:hypothetical protein